LKQFQSVPTVSKLLDSDVDGLDSDVDGLDSDVDGLDSDVDGLDSDVDDDIRHIQTRN